MKKLSTFIFGIFMFQMAFSQVQFNISDDSGDSGQTVSVDVRVSDFVDISSMQFSINWDPTVMEYSSIENISTVVPQFNINFFGTPDQPSIDEGELSLTWNQTSTEGFTIPEQNHLLFTLVCDLTGSPCDETDVFLSDVPRVIEFIDGDGNLVSTASNDGNASINGSNCGNTDGEIDIMISNETTTSGGSVCFEVTVDDFLNVNSAEIPIQWNTAQLTNASVENEALNGAIAAINDAEGTIRYLWQDFTFENPANLANGAKLFDVCFDVTANSGVSACMTIEDIVDVPPNFSTAFLNEDEESIPFTIDNGGCAFVQGGSSDVTFYFEDTELVLGANVCIPVKVRNFDDIQSFQYAMDFNASDLTYTGVSDLNSDLSISQGDFNLNDVDNFRVSWADLSGAGVDLANEVTAFSVCFDVGGDCDQTTDLDFTDNVPNGIEVTDITNAILPVVFESGTLTIICPCNIMQVDAESNNVSCFGGSDGNVTVIADGGNGNYTYMWGNNQSGATLSNVPAGTYTVTVSDGENCNTSATYEVAQPDEIVITGTATDESVNCDGSISSMATGGTGNLTFSWSDDGNITSPNRSNLCKGDYTVTVTDANGCTQTNTFIIEAAPLQVVDVVINDVSCFGGNDGSIMLTIQGGCAPYTSAWSAGPTNLSAGSYAVTITDSTVPNPNVITQTYPINQPDELLIVSPIIVASDGSNGSIDVTVQGGTEQYTYMWTPGNLATQDINMLFPGTYTLVVTDANGCITSQDFVVPTLFIEVMLESNPDNLYNGFDVACAGDCNGIIGGEIIAANGEVTFTLDGSPTSLPITDLCPGTYEVAFTDEDGLTGAQTITIFDADPITASVENTTECSEDSDGGALVTATGGTGSFEYAWSTTNETSVEVANLESGPYTVVLTDDNDCQFMLNGTMDECAPDGPCYEASPVLTPNGDNKNDVFIISCIDNTNNTLFIYDRYGRGVYEQSNYDNTWMGTNNSGSDLIENGYMWVLEVITNDGAREIYKGTVTILRSTY